MIHVKHVGGGVYEMCGEMSTKERCRAYTRLSSLNLPDVFREQLEKDVAICERQMRRALGKKQREITRLKEEIEELKKQIGR